MNPPDHKDIAGIIRQTLTQEDVHLAILFGSQVSGQTHPASDVDLGLALTDTMDARQLGAMSALLAEALGREVDIVDVRRAEGELLAQIVLNGTPVILQDAPLLARLASKALDYAENLRPLVRNALESKINERLHG